MENHLERVRKTLDGQGRILVRYSGTEPLVRIMIEGQDQDRIKTMAEETGNVISKALA